MYILKKIVDNNYIMKGVYSMKSICIKTNNCKEINYLLKEINNLNIEDMYYSSLKFKNYHNIIIHYKGLDYEKYISEITKLLSSMIINIREIDILKKIISYEYFYFDYSEKSKIIDYMYDLETKDDSRRKYNILYNELLSYITANKKIFITGAIPFRIKSYLNYMIECVDSAVNSYLIDREYNEFISILRLYVKSQNSHIKIIHLIYTKSKSILLDENKKIIKDKEFALNAKYLSDISFSENDYALNTILSLIPEKIYIHLVDNKCDEFIDTLKLIFEDKTVICKDCNICKPYKKYKDNFVSKKIGEIP